MTVGELDPRVLRQNVARGQCLLHVGPFIVRFRSTFRSVTAYLASHYRHFELAEENGCHFESVVMPPPTLRRYVRRQALFSTQHTTPFNPVPAALAPGMLEWGLNWCIGTLVQHWIVVHSGGVERNGRVLLLPAAPGSGKSTLTAALASAGWRLFSDEFALVHPADGLLHPIPRPIALKGPSIALLAARVPGARFGPLLEDKEGETTRHMAPPVESVTRMREAARASWIVSPRYQAGASTTLEPVTRARMLLYVADSSFNYNIVGPAGFDRLADLVGGASCYKLTYSSLDEAVALLTGMADERR